MTQKELPSHLPIVAMFGAVTIRKTDWNPKARKARRPKIARWTKKLARTMDEAHAINALGTLARLVG